jgi:ABC-type Fe3+/spermidine/putrescine transport system ATPase subunit
LLDEPLAALDRKLRLRMQGELVRIQRESGIAFVHVTHDQEEALRLADRLAVMEGGRFLQVGPPGEVYDRPASAFVADFLGAANLFEAREFADGLVLPDGTTFSIRSAPPASRNRRSDGDLRMYAIRPEALAVVAEGNRLESHSPRTTLQASATVESRSRVGAYEELVLRTGALSLVAHLRGPTSATGLAPGDSVVLLVNRDDVVKLRESDDAAGRRAPSPRAAAR